MRSYVNFFFLLSLLLKSSLWYRVETTPKITLDVMIEFAFPTKIYRKTLFSFTITFPFPVYVFARANGFFFVVAVLVVMLNSFFYNLKY